MLAAFLIYCAIWFTEWYQKEPVIKYELVPLERQKEKKILENPSIKVCYNILESFMKLINKGIRFDSNPMLRPSDRRISWSRKPNHTRWNRSSD